MKGIRKPIVKVCCISSVEEALMAAQLGASALGFVGRMPSGPGVIDDRLIRDIVVAVPSSISTFLLTSETEFDTIINHHKRVNTDTIQIVDDIDDGLYLKIKEVLPFISLVQVIHVIDESSIDEAIVKSKYVDAILLDSGNPHLEIKELGGTGRIHNWDISRIIREEIAIPLFLAGGLNKANVRQAIEEVQPFGLDLCSGVRTNGHLDKVKLKEFFEVINLDNNSF